MEIDKKTLKHAISQLLPKSSVISKNRDIVVDIKDETIELCKRDSVVISAVKLIEPDCLKKIAENPFLSKEELSPLRQKQADYLDKNPWIAPLLTVLVYRRILSSVLCPVSCRVISYHEGEAFIEYVIEMEGHNVFLQIRGSRQESSIRAHTSHDENWYATNAQIVYDFMEKTSRKLGMTMTSDTTSSVSFIKETKGRGVIGARDKEIDRDYYKNTLSSGYELYYFMNHLDEARKLVNRTVFNMVDFCRAKAAAVALYRMNEVDTIVRLQGFKLGSDKTSGPRPEAFAIVTSKQVLGAIREQFDSIYAEIDDTDIEERYLEIDKKYGKECIGIRGTKQKREQKTTGVKCHLVKYEACEQISDKAYKITCFDGSSAVVPMSQCYGFSEYGKSDSVYVAEWFLSKKDINLQHSITNTAWFDKNTGEKIA